MIKIAVFPGQGAQAVGMGRGLFEASPEARAVFDRVDAALGEALSALAFAGPEARLTLTENAQPALMATSLAAARALEARAGRPFAELFDAVAGHSLGEYSALAAAGALPLEDAARLVRLRGRAMQAAVRPGAGAMAAILGLAVADVEAVAAEAAGPGEPCELANDNADGQAVVSGAAAAVARAVVLARARGAKRAVPLQVSAPFHCSLMEPAADALADALRRTAFATPRPPLVANVTARLEADPARLPDLLARQVTGRVRWRESMATMAGLGAALVVELGPGRVLSGLARRALPGAAVLSVQGPEDLDAAAEALLATAPAPRAAA